MKKALLLTLALSSALGAMAYDFPYLNFKTVSGAEKSMSVENLNITISEGKLLVTNASGSETFDLTQLESMQFSEYMSSAEVTIAGDAEVEVYSLLGVSCGKFANIEAVKSSLEPGIYLVKSGVKTIKIAVK